MPWRECHTMDERLRFVARLLDGEKMARLCREFEITGPVFRPPRSAPSATHRHLTQPIRRFRSFGKFSWVLRGAAGLGTKVETERSTLIMEPRCTAALCRPIFHCGNTPNVLAPGDRLCRLLGTSPPVGARRSPSGNG
jgi:hypothetical protein